MTTPHEQPNGSPTTSAPGSPSIRRSTTRQRCCPCRPSDGPSPSRNQPSPSAVARCECHAGSSFPVASTNEAPRRETGRTSVRRRAYPSTSKAASALSAALCPPENSPDPCTSSQTRCAKCSATKVTAAARPGIGVGNPVFNSDVIEMVYPPAAGSARAEERVIWSSSRAIRLFDPEAQPQLNDPPRAAPPAQRV